MVRVEPLSAAAFAPFGEVIAADLLAEAAAGKSANQGSATRFDFAAALESTRPDSRPNLAVFRAEGRELPFQLRLLERHPCSTQAFLPLVCTRFLICVAPTGADGRPDVSGVRAFLCLPGQGINSRRGVWHHPIIALDEGGSFAMLAWEDGSAQDCVEHWFGPDDAPLSVQLP